MTELTPEQQNIIIDNNLSKVFNVSVPDLALRADHYKFYLANKGRFSTLSAFIREGMRCHMANGVDWQAKSGDDGKLDKILEKIENLKVVEIKPDEVEEIENKSFDASGGFVE